MSLIVKDRVYEQLSEGLHNVQITRVEDLGQQDTMYGTKDQARVFFTALDQRDKEGKAVDCPMTVTCSLHAKSKEGKRLNALGNNHSEEGYELNGLVGKKCPVVIAHAENKETGRPYAKIISVIKLRAQAPVAEV